MALFCGWRFFVNLRPGPLGFLSASGNGSARIAHLPSPNTRETPPYDPWRENIGKKCTPKILKLKNSPTQKSHGFLLDLFGRYKQPDETPQLYTKPRSLHELILLESGQRHEKTPTGESLMSRQLPKKKWQNGCMANSIYFCCASFLLLKKKSCNSNDIG